jgi:hypothetical protein
MIYVTEMKAANIGQMLETIDGTDKGTIELKDAFGVRVYWKCSGSEFLDYKDVDRGWSGIKFVD